jgi:hypothetical protein
MAAVQQEAVGVGMDVPPLEENALVLARQIVTLLNRKSTHFTSGLIEEIAKLPLVTSKDYDKLRAKRLNGIWAIEQRFKAVKRMVPVWRQIGEPKIDEIVQAVDKLETVIKQLRA